MTFLLQNRKHPSERVTYDAGDFEIGEELAMSKAEEQGWSDWLLFANHREGSTPHSAYTVSHLF